MAAHVFEVQRKFVLDLQFEGRKNRVLFLEHVIDLGNLFVGLEICRQVRNRQKHMGSLFVVAVHRKHLQIVERRDQISELSSETTSGS
jgi:hypothetical protein